LGEIVDCGSNVTQIIKGQHVAYMQYGAFADYISVNADHVFPVPGPDPCFLPLLVSGLTASIALEENVKTRSDKESKVSFAVTAAAGGTGQFAVQLAKLSGFTVIGKTSSDEKASFLYSVGCDEVINYKLDDVGLSMKKLCPNGIDYIYESVGGPMFDVCLSNIATKGRLIVIGFITDYAGDQGMGFKPNKALATLPAKLLRRSASVSGFFLFHYADLFRSHFDRLSNLYQSGQLVSKIDMNHEGLETIPDAVEFLHSGQGLGKVIVQL